jgi:hypothetical protein
MANLFRNILFTKVKAGILYYSLVVIILSASVISLVLLSSYYENRVITLITRQTEIERNVDSALNLFMEGFDIFKRNDSTTVNLFESVDNKVHLTKREWGNYLIVKASAKWKSESSSRIALIGTDLFSEEPVALFMPDDGRILSLNGNTRLIGNCYLPGKTARVSAIEGQQYKYKELVFGQIKASPHSLPSLNNSLLNFADSIVSNGLPTSDSIISINAIDTGIVTNSFNNRTLIINAGTVKSLAGYSFSGNIIIWSTLPVTIDKSTKLEDVIVFAPQIRVKSGFKGAFQAFAVQSVKIDDNCDLCFPSQLCVIHSEGKYNPSDSLIISLGQNSKLSGAAIIKTHGLTSFIKIDKGASINGQIYCPGLIELSGEIIGSLFCKGFYLKTAKANYYNHLLNTSIDFNRLSKNFVGVDLIRQDSIKSVIKWLE